MPKVTFMPMNITVEAKVGDTLLDLALQYDIPLEHACGGYCSCTTCHVHVANVESEGQMEGLLSVMGEDERERLSGVENESPRSRLGCQAQVQKDLTVVVQNFDC